MKRFFFLIVLVMMASWIVKSHRSTPRSPGRSSGHWTAAGHEHDGEARRALAEARDEVREAIDEARDEVHHAFQELRVAFASDNDPPRAPVPPPVPAEAAEAVEEVDGLPVRIVAGTRVTEAKARPPASAALASAAVAPAKSTPAPQSTVTGRLSATKERAIADARRKLRDDVSSWLDPEVPRSWAPPTRMLDAMVLAEPEIKSIQKDYGEVFEATLKTDMSSDRRAALVDVYNRQLVDGRLAALGASLAFTLICLAALSGYIRADEATKGYYTNRLRMLTAAGVGASGVLLYHMIA